MRPSIVLASLLSLTTLPLVSTPVVAQDVNPYGRIDPVAASVSVLRRAIGPDGIPGAVIALDDADVPEIARLLEVLLDHPSASIRTTAAMQAAIRGADPQRLRDRLGEEDARAAFVVGLLADDRLDSDTATRLLATSAPDAAPVAIAILAGRATGPDARPRLSALAADPNASPMARGIAAGCLEASAPGSVAGWLAELGDLRPDDRDRAIFEAVTALERLEATPGLLAILDAVDDRAADDALRAAVVLALLRLDPDAGGAAWTALAAATDADRAIPTAMLLASANRPLPANAASTLPSEDDLQKAVRAMLIAAPEDRPTQAIEAVRLGHLPTIRWLLDLPDGEVPPDVLVAMIDTGTTNRRVAMVDVVLRAAERLAAASPARVGRLLADAADDDATREILLRGLVQAGTADAAEVAAPYASARDRRTRSLALLALARGGEPDEASVRRLGRAAAGGGDLPEDLRPLAAWHHLALEGRLTDVIPTLLTP